MSKTTVRSVAMSALAGVMLLLCAGTSASAYKPDLIRKAASIDYLQHGEARPQADAEVGGAGQRGGPTQACRDPARQGDAGLVEQRRRRQAGELGRLLEAAMLHGSP